MTAAASGSEAAMLAAQHAPIGAKICSTRAIRTIGRKFFSRLRIANPSKRELITLRVRSRGEVPGLFASVAQMARLIRRPGELLHTTPLLAAAFLAHHRPPSDSNNCEIPKTSAIPGILKN